MLIRLVIFATALQLLNQPPQTPPSAADLEWVEQHLAAAHDQLMPLVRQGQAAAYRVTRDRWTDNPESYFSIDRRYSYQPPGPTRETLVATVITMAADRLGGELFPKSIREQLLQLHMRDRTASLETLVTGMSVRRRQLTELQCPAIAHRMNELRGMAIILPGSVDPASRKPGEYARVPAVHPAVHEVVVSVQGAHIRATVTDPESRIVQWAIQTRDDLNECIRS